MARIFFETSTALAANGTYDGAALGVIGDGAAAIRDAGAALDAGNGADSFGAVAHSDQAGTLYIDGAFAIAGPWRQVGSAAVAAGAPGEVSAPVRFRYYRVRYVNGATATGAGAFAIHSSFLSSNGLSSAASGGGATSANQTNGSQRTQIFGTNGIGAVVNGGNGDSNDQNSLGLLVYGNNRYFNDGSSGGTLGWDRARGDTSGAYLAAGRFFTESTTALAASATFNGALRTNGGTAGGPGSRFSFFVAEAFSDVAGGTLFIDKTVDGGTTYRQVGSIALVAGTSVTLKVPISAAGYRARVVNGGTAQGSALFASAYSLN